MARATVDLAPLEARAGFGAATGLMPYRWLLLLRFSLLNLVGLALLATAWLQGWIDAVLTADTTHVCKLIFALFVVGLVWAARRVGVLSRELNALDGTPDPTSRARAFLTAIRGRDAHTRAALAGAMRLKLVQRIAPVRHMASTLVLIGLIGTIVGFIIALSGVNPQAISDPGSVAPMIATLLGGMAMALYKTLVGSVLNIWLMVNYRVLETGSVHLLAHLIEVGERDAGV